MYEAQTYEAILQRMLNRVPADVDKREGSIIYDALAPAAAELAQMYIELDTNMRLTFADTSSGEYLTRRAAEIGISRKPATKARRRGFFYDGNNALMDVPIGSRFRIDDVIFVAVEKLAVGDFVLECETAGEVGNVPSGDMLPIDYINGLSKAVVADIIERGAEEEDDESLRRRYFDNLRGQAFGGNIADYKSKTLAIEGVMAVKVYPVWNGPGTVKLVILGANYLPADSGLVDRVQNDMDPPPQGEGYGIAPIGHVVTVESAAGVSINVETTLTLDTGYTTASVMPDVTAKIEAYLDELRKSWQDTNQTIVRVALIDARILDVPGVLDVTGTKLNGVAANVTLASDEVPVLGQVMING
ncbi:baseplate J/gp47 family protein [Thermicanus aegyptius]|uniref:baseplate J/gp47 family protein n=1 Tax=Thermicanus aegyptius TaxID=94009 RepID=UPI000415D82A|nr:baseplate J/gp47 family protein [Thermicanus aegyptius]